MRDLRAYAQIVNDRLDEIFTVIPEGQYDMGKMPWLLNRSMRYSLFAGGKRLMPAMLLAAVEMLGGSIEDALDCACAVEMIHTSSLIHDDLPSMDDDALRRGKPTNHVVFGEGQAILAGDGLLNFAYETMLTSAIRHPGQAQSYLLAMQEIATGTGATGMIAGQAMDLHCEANRIRDERALEYIQRNKTACMFICPLRAAARLCGADRQTMEALTRYGRAFGLLFQATDDLLDVTGDADSMGKIRGRDAERGKLTCISTYGVSGTRALVERLRTEAHDALEPFGDRAGFFADLVDSMLNRTQ